MDEDGRLSQLIKDSERDPDSGDRRASRPSSTIIAIIVRRLKCSKSSRTSVLTSQKRLVVVKEVVIAERGRREWMHVEGSQVDDL